MGFLDDANGDWTRPELRELRDLLVLAYRRPTVAEQLADEAGIVPGTFPLLPNMRATWTAAVRELLNQGKLRTLVMGAAADPTAAAFRPRFEEMLEGAPQWLLRNPRSGSAPGRAMMWKRSWRRDFTRSGYSSAEAD